MYLAEVWSLSRVFGPARGQKALERGVPPELHQRPLTMLWKYHVIYTCAAAGGKYFLKMKMCCVFLRDFCRFLCDFALILFDFVLILLGFALVFCDTDIKKRLEAKRGVDERHRIGGGRVPMIHHRGHGGGGRGGGSVFNFRVKG